MDRFFRQFVLPLFAGLLALPAGAQDDACLDRTVFLSVVDRQGNPVAGLDSTNFRGKWFGKQAIVHSVSPIDFPRRMVILMDKADFLTVPEGSLATVLAADLIASIPPSAETEMALAFYYDKIEEKTDFTRDRSSLLETLHRASQEKGRRKNQDDYALFDAKLQALALLSPAQSDDVIYIIRGADDTSSLKWNDGWPQGLHAVYRAGVRLFGVILHFSEYLQEPSTYYGPPAGFRPKATGIGGTILWGGALTFRMNYWKHFSQAQKGLLAQSQKIYLEIAHSYRLGIEFPKVRANAYGGWNLEIVPPAGISKKSLTLNYSWPSECSHTVASSKP